MPPFSSPLAPSTLQLPYVSRIPPPPTPRPAPFFYTEQERVNLPDYLCVFPCSRETARWRCFPAQGNCRGEVFLRQRDSREGGRGGGGVPWETIGRRCLPATGRQSGRGVSPKHGDNRGEVFPWETVGGGVSLQYGGSRGEVFPCNRETLGERRFPATGR